MDDLKNKRLVHELKVLDQKLNQSKLDFIIGFYREDLNVVFFLDTNFGIIIVNIDFNYGSYPFSPPKVYIGDDKKKNKINYLKVLNIENSRLKRSYKKNNKEFYYLAEMLEVSDNYYKNLTNIRNCLCCTSIICGDFWNPCIKIPVILKEIFDNHHLIERIRYMIFAKVIMRKYLNSIITVIYDFI
jgi:hypothetical protein